MKGMRAVLTGHSRGLGEAIAEELLDRGIAVLALARRGNPALAARHGGRLREVALDLADTAALAAWLGSGALQAWLAEADEALLINNAGTLQPMGPLTLQDPVAVARAVASNVGAPLALAAAFAAAGPQARRVLHVSSGAARKPYAGWSVYCATKAALDHHARAVAAEAHPGLRIASVAPGVLDTAMQAEIRSSSVQRFPQRARFDELYRHGGLSAPEHAGARLVDYLLGEHFGSATTTDLRDLPVS